MTLVNEKSKYVSFLHLNFFQCRALCLKDIDIDSQEHPANLMVMWLIFTYLTATCFRKKICNNCIVYLCDMFQLIFCKFWRFLLKVIVNVMNSLKIINGYYNSARWLINRSVPKMYAFHTVIISIFKKI